MILDDYSLDKSLGKGAFGEVFLTTQKGSDKLFATKKIERNSVEKDDMVKYFINEVQILRELDHPNIAKFQCIKKTKNHYYIIMEYCNGGELYKTLKKYMEKNNGRPFTQEIVQHLMRQIVNAFRYIHKKDIIHRDIKLENILLNYETEQDKKDMNLMKAQVKIIDFGFAAKIDRTGSGLKYTTLGSPINMDPIILNKLKQRGKKTRKLGYDQKADIWSLGTICYEMLIGKSVFSAEDLDELVTKVENGTYTVPTTLSKEVISFLNGMLQYNSNQRLTIEELANHRFLTKNVKDFERIDVKKASKNVNKDLLTINIKKNKSIWCIFDKGDEDKLLGISAQCFDKPINEENNVNMNKDLLNNNKNNIKPNFQNNNINNMPKFQNNNINNMPNLQNNNIQKKNTSNFQNNNINNMPNLQNNNIQKNITSNLQNNNLQKNITSNLQNNNLQKNNMNNLQNNNLQKNNMNNLQSNHIQRNNMPTLQNNNIQKNNLPNFQNNNMLNNNYKPNIQNNNNIKNNNVTNIQNNNMRNNMNMLNNNRPSLPINNIQNNIHNNNINNAQNNCNKNNYLNNNNRNNNLNNVNNKINNPLPVAVNMPYGVVPAYTGMTTAYGYQGYPVRQVQPMVGVPMMAIPQMQQYGTTTGYMYTNARRVYY